MASGSSHHRLLSDFSQELDRDTPLWEEVGEEVGGKMGREVGEEVREEVDMVEEEDEEREIMETPVADQASDHTFTPQIGRPSRSMVDPYTNPPPQSLSPLPAQNLLLPPLSESVWSKGRHQQQGEEREEEPEEVSTTDEIHSLSSTPVGPDDQIYTSFTDTARDRAQVHKDGPDFPFVSPIARGGNLEETLKSAVHATQALLNHSPPQHLQTEPTAIPTGCRTGAEATQALLSLSTFSFSETKEPATSCHPDQQHSEPSSLLGVPQGPTLIPDSIELSLLNHRELGESRDQEKQEEVQMFTNFSQRGNHTVAYRSYAMESGYVKTGMATPHIIEPALRNQTQVGREGRTIENTLSLSGEPDRPQSLNDFIDAPLERVPVHAHRKRWRGVEGKIGDYC